MSDVLIVVQGGKEEPMMVVLSMLGKLIAYYAKSRSTKEIEIYLLRLLTLEIRLKLITHHYIESFSMFENL